MPVLPRFEPRKILLAGVVAVAFATWITAAQTRYLDPSQVDLVLLLGPPPAPQSAAGRADIAAVLAAQAARTDAEVKAAQADDEISVFRFAEVMGPGFTAQNLPFAASFLNGVGSEANQALAAAKERFNRPRPVAEDSRVMPVVRAASASYPSGTAAFAYAVAILLADMVPEKAAAIFARAADYAHNRVVAGVHYPTDIEAGRIAGAVIDNMLLHDAAFMADLAKARAEVRLAIGFK